MIISIDTLRRQDLIPAFIDALDRYCGNIGKAKAQQIMSPGAGFSAFPLYAREDEDSEWWDSEDSMYLLEELFDALEECAPEGTYFGTSEGDGACFGFWAIEDVEE